MHYIDLITLFYKERKITSTNIDTIDLPEYDIVIYIESVLDTEMIFYEFCELIFFISRKYFQYNGIVLEEEEQRRSQDLKKSRRKTKRIKKDEDDKETSGLNDPNYLKSSQALHQVEEKLKSDEYYTKVINEIYKAKEIFMKKNECQIGINKFFYPHLKSHTIIENLREQERLRKLEEERIKQDIIRYNLERNALKDEDINIYREDNEENESEDNSEY
jgi:hypothetical protein